MSKRFRAIVGMMFLLALAGFNAPFAHAADDPVRVRFENGDVQVMPLAENAKFFTNRNYPLRGVPAEMKGLTFTQRPGG